MSAETIDTAEHAPWPLRALLLAGIGAVFGFLFHRLVDVAPDPGRDQALRASGAAFLAVGGIVFAFSLERVRWSWSAAFALLAGLTAAFVAWWNGAPQGGQGEEWQFISALVAIAIAVPLFQSARDRGTAVFAPAAVHAHAWSNLILGAAAAAFAGATMLLLLLLSELFALIGLTFLRELIQEGWFAVSVACAALGAAAGLLRDRDRITGTMQRVARAILSVLAPLLAAGLLLFVLALPFTGLDPLWEKTRSTTPILLLCIVGAVFLIAALTGNDAEEEATSPVLRWSGVALIAVLLPLAVVAGVSTARRIGQHGFTPDRLWAMVFVAIAAAFAIGYLLALVRGRRLWPEALRRANVRLAAGVCLLALFLALPIVSFGAISARDQVARLEQGKVSPDRFDWAALRFDFGPAGDSALRRLASAGPPPVRVRAAEVLAATNRWALAGPEPAPPARPEPPVAPRLSVTPAGAAVPRPLYQRIMDARSCAVQTCRLVLTDPSTAVLLSLPCPDCEPDAALYEARPDGQWFAAGSALVRTTAPPPTPPGSAASDAAARLPAGAVEVRTVEKRQVFVDGRPVGGLID
jgi:hypothetical protein